MNFPGFWGESRHVQWGIAAVGSAALCGRASRSSEDGAVYVSPIPVRGGSAGAFSKVRRGGTPRPRDDRRSSRADSVSPAENLLLPRVRPVHDAGPIDCAIGPASAAGHLALRGLRQDRNDRMPSLVRQAVAGCTGGLQAAVLKSADALHRLWRRRDSKHGLQPRISLRSCGLRANARGAPIARSRRPYWRRLRRGRSTGYT